MTQQEDDLVKTATDLLDKLDKHFAKKRIPVKPCLGHLKDKLAIKFVCYKICSRPTLTFEFIDVYQLTYAVYLFSIDPNNVANIQQAKLDYFKAGNHKERVANYYDKYDPNNYEVCSTYAAVDAAKTLELLKRVHGALLELNNKE